MTEKREKEYYSHKIPRNPSQVSLCTITSCTFFTQQTRIKMGAERGKYSTSSSTWVPGRSKSLGPLIISPAQLSGQLLRSLEAPILGLSAGTYVHDQERDFRVSVYVFFQTVEPGTQPRFPRTLNFCYLIAVRRLVRSLKQFQGPLADPEKRTLRANYVLTMFRVVGETGILELRRSLSKPVDFTSTPKNVLSERGTGQNNGGGWKKKEKEEKKFVTMDYRETIEKKR